MSVLDVIKTLLGIEDDKQDALLKLYEDMATQSILNYCNLDALPDGLQFVAAQMAVEMYHVDHPKGDDMGIAQHISEAGRTVIFRRAEAESVEAARYQHVLDSRKAQLHRYRKLQK